MSNDKGTPEDVPRTETLTKGSTPSLACAPTQAGELRAAIHVLLTCDEEHTDRQPGYPCVADYCGAVLRADSDALVMRVDRWLDDGWSAHPLESPAGKVVRIAWSRIVNMSGQGWGLHAHWVDDDAEMVVPDGA